MKYTFSFSRLRSVRTTTERMRDGSQVVSMVGIDATGVEWYGQWVKNEDRQPHGDTFYERTMRTLDKAWIDYHAGIPVKYGTPHGETTVTYPGIVALPKIKPKEPIIAVKKKRAKK